MPNGPGGFKTEDVNDAFQAFLHASSFDDLQGIIHEVPLINEPFFHAILRQEYLRSINQRSPNLEGFANRYHALFRALHFPGTQTELDAPLLGDLIPAFLIGGATSVLGCLWPIKDITSVKFQSDFYRHLLAGNSPAVSLSKTQRGVLMVHLDRKCDLHPFGRDLFCTVQVK